MHLLKKSQYRSRRVRSADGVFPCRKARRLNLLPTQNGFILGSCGDDPEGHHEGDFQTNQLDEQELAALSLHLLEICLIYVNTLLIQRVLAEPRHFQAMQPADWRGLTPLFYQHINPYGTFRLDMNERMHIEEEVAMYGS